MGYIYIPYKLSHEIARQISFEEMMFGKDEALPEREFYDPTATRVIKRDRWHMPQAIVHSDINVDGMITKLKAFNMMTAELKSKPRKSLYNHFEIPKKADPGKMRPIDAPCDELKTMLSFLQVTLDSFMLGSYHTAAFAYISGRDTYRAVQKHQRFKPNWIAKYDFHGFFPSTTLEFILNQFKIIYPLNLIMERADGAAEMREAMDLCMLNGGLPQGTPISPWITNCMMIPFDYELSNSIHRFTTGRKKSQGENGTDRFCYTRYADDIQISCKVDFDPMKVQGLIIATLRKFNAPFVLNAEKTHYGSRSGHDYMLGYCLNQENKITVGWEKHKQFKNDLYNYLMARRTCNKWSVDAVQKLNGIISYYHRAEESYIDYIINQYNKKFSTDIMKDIAEDLSMG